MVLNILRATYAAVAKEEALFVPHAVEDESREFEDRVVKPFINNNVKVKLQHRNWFKKAMHKVFNTKHDDDATPMMAAVLDFLRCDKNKTLNESIAWTDDLKAKDKQCILFPIGAKDTDNEERPVPLLMWGVDEHMAIITTIGARSSTRFPIDATP